MVIIELVKSVSRYSMVCAELRGGVIRVSEPGRDRAGMGRRTVSLLMYLGDRCSDERVQRNVLKSKL